MNKVICKFSFIYIEKIQLDMMKCNDLIDMPIMRLASQYMDKNWRMVFRDLGISDPEIDQITQPFINTSGVIEIIYRLLLIWERNSDDPSLGKLISVLWKNKQFKCVDELEKLYAASHLCAPCVYFRYG